MRFRGPNSEAPEPAYHTPGKRGLKLAYLCVSAAVFAVGCWFLGEILYPLLLGVRTEARVTEIRLQVPGEPVQSIKHRRPYEDYTNYLAIYSHYVSVPVGNGFEQFRLSLDSRRAPIEFYNINDRVDVAFLPNNPRKIAYAYKDARTWGIGGMFFALGSAMLATAIPMLLAVGKPIPIDPEPPEEPTP